MFCRGDLFSLGGVRASVARRGGGIAFGLHGRCYNRLSCACGLFSPAVFARVHFARAADEACVLTAAKALPGLGTPAYRPWAVFVDALVDPIGVRLGAPRDRSGVASFADADRACTAWFEPLHGWLAALEAVLCCWSAAVPFAVAYRGSVGW